MVNSISNPTLISLSKRFVYKLAASTLLVIVIGLVATSSQASENATCSSEFVKKYNQLSEKIDFLKKLQYSGSANSGLSLVLIKSITADCFGLFRSDTSNQSCLALSVNGDKHLLINSHDFASQCNSASTFYFSNKDIIDYMHSLYAN